MDLTKETTFIAIKKGFNPRSKRYFAVAGIRPVSRYPHADPEGKLPYVNSQSDLQTWLRNERNTFVLVLKPTNTEFIFWIQLGDNRPITTRKGYSETYEEALEKGLQEALKLI